MLEAVSSDDLPAIPSKRYFTIGEVSELCGLKPHVLRYWEQEFPSLQPVKRRGNRRYYQRHDVLLIRKIRTLLYEEGYTIGGARQQLAGAEGAKQNGTGRQQTTSKPYNEPFSVKAAIQELEAIIELLEA